MTEMSELDRLGAIEDIKTLKARYFRFVDTKEWDLLAGVFTTDCTFRFEGVSAGLAASYDSVADFVRGVQESLGDPDAASVHHGSMPEICVADARSATGIWQMTDYVLRPPGHRFPSFRGYGHYHETYRKEDQWLISSVVLSRLLRIDLPRGAYDSL